MRMLKLLFQASPPRGTIEYHSPQDVAVINKPVPWTELIFARNITVITPFENLRTGDTWVIMFPSLSELKSL